MKKLVSQCLLYKKSSDSDSELVQGGALQIITIPSTSDVTFGIVPGTSNDNSGIVLSTSDGTSGIAPAPLVELPILSLTPRMAILVLTHTV